MQNYQVLEPDAVASEPPAPALPPQRTPKKRAFESGLVYGDADYQDAYDLTQSTAFETSSRELEREPLVCRSPIEAVLDEHSGAVSAFWPLQSQWNEMNDLCKGEDGLIHGQIDLKGHFHYNPIIEHLEKKMKPFEEAYWKTLEKLNVALTVETVVCMKEALALAGVTDKALMDEICRCVIKGGDLWDGKNDVYPLDEGKAAPHEKPAAFTPSEEAAPHPLLCRCINTRLEALLMRHEPNIFPRWRAEMTVQGHGPDTCRYWSQMVAYVAAILPLVKRGEDKSLNKKSVNADTLLQNRRTDRNLNLLLRLVLKGCRRRGEC